MQISSTNGRIEWIASKRVASAFLTIMHAATCGISFGTEFGSFQTTRVMVAVVSDARTERSRGKGAGPYPGAALSSRTTKRAAPAGRPLR